MKERRRRSKNRRRKRRGDEGIKEGRGSKETHGKMTGKFEGERGEEMRKKGGEKATKRREGRN